MEDGAFRAFLNSEPATAHEPCGLLAASAEPSLIERCKKVGEGYRVFFINYSVDRPESKLVRLERVDGICRLVLKTARTYEISVGPWQLKGEAIVPAVHLIRFAKLLDLAGFWDVVYSAGTDGFGGQDILVEALRADVYRTVTRGRSDTDVEPPLRSAMEFLNQFTTMTFI